MSLRVNSDGPRDSYSLRQSIARLKKGETDASSSKYVINALIEQIAALTHCDHPESGLPICALSFGGTPATEVTLKSDGYKPTGTRMPKTKWPLYERILARNPLNPTDYLFQPFCPKLPPAAATGDCHLRPPTARRPARLAILGSRLCGAPRTAVMIHIVFPFTLS